MPIHTQTFEALPLCSALAQQGKHLVFAAHLEMLKKQYKGFQRNTLIYLDGMLAAYAEQGVITAYQLQKMADELITFANGVDA